MAPKILSGLAKMMKPKKRRTRKTCPETAKDKAADPPAAVTTTTVTTTKKSNSKPTLTVTTSGAVEASKNFGGSSATCCSSGYLQMDDTTKSDSFLYSMSTNTSTTTPHTLVTVCSSEEDATSHTFCGSDSDSPSALPPRPTRAKRSQSCTAVPPSRRSLMGSNNHNNKSLSFRLRKRNRALSDVDFDRLLTASRGWTFDPNDCSSISSTPQHYRHDAMAQTDFERYIFAPQNSSTSTASSNNRRSSAPPTMFVQVPACCLDMPTGPRRSTSCDTTTPKPRPLRASAPPRVPAKQGKPSNPFFLPIESCCH